MRHAYRSEIDSHRLLGGLKTLDKWLCWRAVADGDSFRKKPVVLETIDDEQPAEAYMRNPDQWMSYTEATQTLSEHEQLEGLQVVIDVSADDFVVIDFDDCVDPETGRIDPTVRQYLRMTDSYAEVSPSGTGIHLILRGNIYNQGWPEQADPVDGEIYDKFIVTVTEEHIAGRSYRAQQTDAVLQQYFEDNNVAWRDLLF